MLFIMLERIDIFTSFFLSSFFSFFPFLPSLFPFFSFSLSLSLSLCLSQNVMATFTAYGSSWARDGLQAAAAILCHSCGNTRSLNPLHWTEDRTYASTATRAAAVRFLTHCTTSGNSRIHLHLYIILPDFQKFIFFFANM